MFLLFSLQNGPTPRRACRRGFTLAELLVTLGLLALLGSMLVIGLPPLAGNAALRSGQAVLVDLVGAARAKAMASGRKTRILINEEPARPDRYLRFLVLQQGRQPGPNPQEWETMAEVELAEGVFVVPARLDGLVENPAEWKTVSDPLADLVSTALADQRLTLALSAAEVPQRWTGLAFTVNGTLSPVAGGPPPRGLLILARGRARTVQTNAGPPLELLDPHHVRGISLSAYGVPALLNDRAAF